MKALPDLAQPVGFLAAVIVIFAVVVGRYFLIAGLFHLTFYRWKPERWQHRKINQRNYKQGQFRKEAGWSMITAALFAVAGAATALLWQKGHLRLY